MIGRMVAASTQSWTFTAGDDAGYFRGRRSLSGIDVTPDNAMTVSAVYACVSVISESTAALPLNMFRRVTISGQDGKERAGHHPLQELLHDRPNDYQTAIEFREMMTAWALIRGKAVAEIVPVPRLEVGQLIPLHPDLIHEQRLSNGTRVIEYADPKQGGRRRRIDPAKTFILRGRFSRSVLDYARESFGLQLALETWAATLFKRGARPGGVVSHPQALSDKSRAHLRQSIDEMALGGERAGRPLLLEEGMTWSVAQMTQRDAEFLATRSFGIAEVARWFRVPLHKIQEMTNATYSNIDRQAIEYVTDTIVPWCERWEQAISRDLITAPGIYFAEHNIDGLMRGDPVARGNYFRMAILTGWMSPQEVRAKDNLNPVPGLDYYLMPLNEGQVVNDGQPLPVRQPGPPPQGALRLVGGSWQPTRADDEQGMAYLRLMVRDAAARVMRRETGTLARLAKGDDWAGGVRAFYHEHAPFVAEALKLDEGQAQRYCEARRDALIRDGADSLMTFDSADAIDGLTAVAMARLQPPALPAAA